MGGDEKEDEKRRHRSQHGLSFRGQPGWRVRLSSLCNTRAIKSGGALRARAVAVVAGSPLGKHHHPAVRLLAFALGGEAEALDELVLETAEVIVLGGELDGPAQLQ